MENRHPKGCLFHVEHGLLPMEGDSVSTDSVSDDPLLVVLERARALGFLGPGPVVNHIDHARAFSGQVPRQATVLDLGSGGGIPGLVVAHDRPGIELVLLDAMERRGEFLHWAVGILELGDRVQVVIDRAETAARLPELRHAFDVVLSRSFGAPAVTAECAVGFLRPPDRSTPGGALVVSEPPPGAARRWSAELLSTLALRDEGLSDGDGARLRVLRAVGPCDDRYPRRVGVPAKRPLA